ncbi:MAG: TolC family protein [Terracidiphilus sp.]
MRHIDEVWIPAKAEAKAACVLLAFALCSGTVIAQQASAGQTPQALPLPTSGRGSQSVGLVYPQQMTLPAGASVVQPFIMVTGNYQGSVPGTPVAGGPLLLSMADAVRRGLQTNLGVITSDVASSTVRAQRLEVLSQMLPQVSASAGESVMQVNLASYGFNAISSSIPPVIGPFQYVQAQANFNWNALSLTNFRNVQAANAVDRATRLNLRDARELVVLAVGGSYLQVVSAAARIESQRRQVEYAQAIYDRANTQLTAGTNTRVDLTRSRVQLQAEQERLLSLEGEYDQQKIAFARLIGLPQNTDIVFTEPLELKESPTVDEADALRAALERRWDLRSAAEQRTAAERTLSAARGERLPSVSFNGYYGVSGTHPNESHGNFVAQGTVNLPIFDGGRISGDIRQAQATLQQRQSEYDDQKARVEQDVRNALIQLRVAAGQVKLAESNRQYAQETLTQSRDRFEAGVTNTVEVVQAQQQQASAENDYISSLFAWNLARLSLARAIGDAETELTTLFPGEKH